MTHTGEVRLAIPGDEPCAAGLVLAAKGADNLYTITVTVADPTLQQGLGPAQLEAWRRDKGSYPKVLRIAQRLRGEWSLVAQTLIDVPDRDWFLLRYEASGSDLSAWVEQQGPVQVQVGYGLDGRHGLCKAGGGEARFKDWRWGTPTPAPR